MNCGFSNRSRPNSTRSTAGLRLSYRIFPVGTPPNISNACTCPSRNASVPTLPYAMCTAPRMRQPHHEHVQLQAFSSDDRDEVTEIDLRIRTRKVSLRHRDHASVRADLDLQIVHQRPDRGLRHPSPLLVEQPLPHPPGGVPLLPRLRQIRLQPAPHHRLPLPDTGRPDRLPPLRRHRVSQRRPHRPPMHPVP